MHTVSVLTGRYAELRISSAEVPLEYRLAEVLAYAEVFLAGVEVCYLQGPRADGWYL